MQHHTVQAPGYSLPTLGPAPPPQQSPQAALNAERDFERERIREQQIAQQRYDQETEMLQQQQREQQQREQQQRELHQSPRENHTSNVPIQQPVASRVPATLHGPNGILNDQHPGVGAAPLPPQAPLGAPSGPGNVFSNGVQVNTDNSLRPFAQQVTQAIPPQNLLGFTNAATPQQLPNGVVALSQGQQPILNVSA
jgi:paired amphipathic helix protein Sin3a